MWSVIKNTFGDFLDDDCPALAASLAYYTMFSLAPVLVIILTVCGLVLDPADVRGQIAHEFNSVVGQQGVEQIQEMVGSVDTSPRTTWATVIGILTLIFGASGVMVQLQAALNKVWEVKPDPEAGGIWNFVLKRTMSLAMLLGVAFILLVSLVVSWILKSLGETLVTYLPGDTTHWVWVVGHELMLVFVATILFALIFKFLPDAQIRWRDVGMGALITAVLFVGGKFAISLYLANSSVASMYGAAGSLVLILVWVYYSAMILLLGAEFTQQWTRSRGRRIHPENGAIRVEEREVTVERAPIAQ